MDLVPKIKEMMNKINRFIYYIYIIKMLLIKTGLFSICIVLEIMNTCSPWILLDQALMRVG